MMPSTIVTATATTSVRRTIVRNTGCPIRSATVVVIALLPRLREEGPARLRGPALRSGGWRPYQPLTSVYAFSHWSYPMHVLPRVSPQLLDGVFQNASEL